MVPLLAKLPVCELSKPILYLLKNHFYFALKYGLLYMETRLHCTFIHNHHGYYKYGHEFIEYSWHLVSWLPLISVEYQAGEGQAARLVLSVICIV